VNNDSELSLSTDDKQAVIKTNSSRFTVPVGAAAEFPQAPSLAADAVACTVSGELLRRAIKQTIFAADVDTGMFTLSGVKIEFRPDGTVSLVSADGRRASYVTVPAECSTTADGLFPSTGMKSLLRLIGQNETVRVVFGTDQWQFSTDCWNFTCQQLAGRFPPWRQFYDQEQDKGYPIITVPTGALVAVIQQAAIASDGTDKGVDLEVQTGPAGGSLVAKMMNAQGNAEASMPVVCDRELNTKVALNYEYVLQFLRCIGDDTVDFRVLDKNSAVFFDTPRGKYIVMPLDN
jgi:DNA polymerase III sliding clamp (beta) subunit (PCNA family)